MGNPNANHDIKSIMGIYPIYPSEKYWSKY